MDPDRWRELILLPKQQAFVDSLVANSCFAGGFGNGKTLAGGTKAITLCERYPGIKGLITRETLQQIKDTQLETIFEWRPDLQGGHNKTEKTIRFRNGSQLLYYPFSEPWKIDGLNIAFCWIDQAEVCPESTVDRIEGRLRQCAKKPGAEDYPRLMFLTCNPAGRNWIYYRYIEKTDTDNPDEYWIANAATNENPFLSEDYKQRLLRNKPDYWVKRFFYGSWDAFAGQIYTQWSPQIHVIDDFEPPAEWERFIVIDPGLRNPTAVLWFAVDWDGNLYVYREHYESGKLVSWHADQIIRAEPQAVKKGKVWIDPSAYNHVRDPTKGDYYCVADEYQERGITTWAADNDVDAGINRVSEYLGNAVRRANCPTCSNLSHQSMSSLRERDCSHGPALYVMKSCENTIREVPQYQWEEMPETRMGKKNPPEKPRDMDDHTCDCLRYGVMARPQPPDYREVSRKKHGTSKDWRRAAKQQMKRMRRRASRLRRAV